MFVSKKKYKMLQDWLDASNEGYASVTRMLFEQHARQIELVNALQDIIAESTSKPNATVKRMVKIAEAALGYTTLPQEAPADDEVETTPESPTATDQEATS